MSVFAASLLAMSLLGIADAEMPADFLKVESKAWSKWLNEPMQVSWEKMPLKSVLANQFGAADFSMDNQKALEVEITLDVGNLTRRTVLWRLSQKYGFTIKWAQKGEPKVFLDLSEAEQREHQVGGVTLTAMTQVMRSDYPTYEKLKLEGKVTKEEIIDGALYYAIDVDRDLHFANATAHVNEVQRYKTSVPPEKVRFEAHFTAKVKWIEIAGKREASVVPIGVDSRWLVGIEILSIEKPGKQLDKKGDVILLVHSPAHLFIEDREKVPGKVYEFKVSGSVSDGRPIYYYAEAREMR